MNALSPASPTKYNILIIDDSQADTDYIADLLRRFARLDLDFKRIVSEPELEAALYAQKWDVILLDFAMPALSAAQALRLSKAIQPKTAVVLVSGMATVGDAVDMMRLGARAFVDKTDRTRLLNIIKEELDASRQLAKTAELRSALDQTEARYQSIVDNQKELICRYDTAYKLTFVNRAYCEWRDRSSEALIGTSIFENIRKEDANDIVAYIKTLTRDNPLGRSMYQGKVVAGRNLIIEWSDLALFNESGQIVEYQCIGRDVTEREQHLKQLREMKDEIQVGSNHLNGILETMQDAIVSFSVADRQLIYASTSFDQVVGYPLEQFRRDGQFFQKIIHPDDLDLALAAHRACLRDGLIEFDHRVVLPDGQVRWLHRHVWVNYDEGGSPIRINDTIRDITERKIAEEALRASEIRYRNIVEDQTELVCRYDRDLKLTFANAAYCKSMGISPDKIIGHSILEGIPPDDHEASRAYIHAIKNDNSVMVNTHRSVEADGSSRWYEWKDRAICDEQGVVIEYQGVGRDITEQRLAEEALRASEEKLRSLLNSQTSYIVRIDLEGNFTYWNGKYNDDFGWLMKSGDTPANALDSLVPYHHERLYEAVAECVAQVGSVRQVELDKPAKDGGIVTTLWEFTCLRDAKGIPSEIQCVGIDITRRQKAEIARRESELRYRQMFELHGLPKLIIDPKTATIMDVNQAAVRYYGYDLETLRGMKISQINTASPEEIKDKMSRSVDQDMASWEFVHRRADGSLRNVEVFSGPVEVDGQKMLYSLITDITEKKRVQTALEEAYALLEQRVNERTVELEKVKNRLEAIFNHSGDGVLLLDVEHGIQQANTTFEEMFGVLPMSYLGQGLAHLFSADSVTRVNQIIQEVAYTHQMQHVEAQAQRIDGQHFDVEINVAPINRSAGAVTGLVCIIRDITERKHAQQLVAEERNLLRTVIDAVPDMIYVKDLQRRILLNNVAHARSLGVSDPAVLTGKFENGSFTDEMAEKFRADDDHVFTTGTAIVATEERTIGANGGEIWALTSKVPLRNLRGELTGLVGITHDISGRKASEEALKQSEKQLRESQKMLQSVLDTIPVRVFWKDRESRYMGCNRLFAEDAGLPPSEIIGKRDQELPWRSLESEGYVSDDKHVMQSAQAKLSYEETQTIADGHKLIIQTSKLPLRDDNNNVIGLLGVYIDITARKEAEDALRDNEEKFRSFVESAPVATIITDDHGLIVLVNRAAEQMWGYRQEELIGQPVETLIPEAAMGAEQSNRITSLMAQDPTVAPVFSRVREYSGRQKDGAVFPAEVQLSYVDVKPSPLLMIHTMDITAKKQAEDVLKQALVHEKELGELKARFVSMTSHEFRTPLATILVIADTLVKYRTQMDEAQIDSRLDKIRQQVHHMRDIMEDVSELANVQAGHIDFRPTEGNLDAMCREIIEEFESQPMHSGRIRYTCTGTPTQSDFDERLMRQVITNLISNALKYSPREKRVSVEMHQDEDELLLRVADQGIGIPDSDFNRIFEPFHRANNVGTISGTGLGLSVAKQAIDLHSGTISAKSKVDVGTIFTVTIPRHQENVMDSRDDQDDR